METSYVDIASPWSNGIVIRLDHAAAGEHERRTERCPML